MNSTLPEKSELQSTLLPISSPFSRQRGLIAQWQMENGKLVCKWVRA